MVEKTSDIFNFILLKKGKVFSIIINPMKVSEFYFELPQELIAQKPVKDRGESRLLILDVKNGNIFHKKFDDILDCLNKGDVIVLNDTKVIKAKVSGTKKSGGKVELLFFKYQDFNNYFALVKGRVGKKSYVIIGDREIEIENYKDNIFLVKEDDRIIQFIIENYGKIPLPPYIKREPEENDELRYQTIFAQKNGSVASPTASLHFNFDIVSKLKQKGVIFTFLTLHVGPGTFLPVKSEDVESHNMLAEYCEISKETAEIINDAISSKRNIIFCGTTVVRAIEWSARNGFVEPKKGYADIFIYPGYKFKIVENMLTNFHLPASTPLMLVSALAGKDLIFKAYEEAIALKYRFFSYGDAMLIWKGNDLDVKNCEKR